MRFAGLLLVSLAVAACGPGGVAPDAGENVDDSGTPGDAGLLIGWRAPGIDQAQDGLTVTQIDLNLRDLRVVGDAAPGDETYRGSQSVKLDGGDEPFTRFDRAPPGMYSAFEFTIARGADGEASWEMRGKVELDGEDVDWELEDEDDAAIELALGGLDLAAGELRTITVDVDVVAILGEIDWENVPRDDGKIVIDDDSPLMPAIRARLHAAFSVASIQ